MTLASQLSQSLEVATSLDKLDMWLYDGSSYAVTCVNSEVQTEFQHSRSGTQSDLTVFAISVPEDKLGFLECKLQELEENTESYTTDAQAFGDRNRNQYSSSRAIHGESYIEKAAWVSSSGGSASSSNFSINAIAELSQKQHCPQNSIPSTSTSQNLEQSILAQQLVLVLV